jgi:uncharacterized membrane protein
MRFPLLLSALLATSALLAQAKEPPKEPAKDHPSKEAAKGTVDFEKQILPILEKSCVECHSIGKTPDGRPRKPKKGVSFEGKDQMLASLKGKLVIAKKSGDSELYKAVSAAADAEGRMPPAKKGEPLPKEQIELIKKWIDEGATFGKWVGKKADDKAGDGDKGKDGGDKPGDKPKGKEPPKPGDQPKSGG